MFFSTSTVPPPVAVAPPRVSELHYQSCAIMQACVLFLHPLLFKSTQKKRWRWEKRLAKRWGKRWRGEGRRGGVVKDIEAGEEVEATGREKNMYYYTIFVTCVGGSKAPRILY